MEDVAGIGRSDVDALFQLIYGELRALARRQRRRWHGDYTLDTTALVHEAYLKLADREPVRAASQAHFMALAARAMRQILCNYARDRQRRKRGGDRERVPLDELRAPPSGTFPVDRAAELLALDIALRKLALVNARQSDVIECRFFGGLSVEETAAALGVSPATVKRDWNIARAWLYREMQANADT